MNGALAVSLGAHGVVVAIWLVLQTVPAPDPAPQVTAEVELVLGTLFEDDDREYVVWKWKPIEGARSDG